MKKLFLISIGLLFFAGCGNRDIVQTDEYEGKRINDATLTVVQLFKEPAIDNTDDVKDDLGEGEALEVYMNFFKERLTDFIASRKGFREVHYVDQIPGSLLAERTLDAREQVKILLPKDGEKLNYDSINTDFILFIDSLHVSRGFDDAVENKPNFPAMPSAPGISVSYSEYLLHTLNFTIWDNTQGKIVSYGKSKKSSGIKIFTMTKGNWESVVDDLFQKIIAYSPFSSQKRKPAK